MTMIGLATTLWILTLGLAFGSIIEERWANEFDKEMNFNCPTGKHINGIISEFSTNKKDRKWDFYCQGTGKVC